MRSNLKKSRVTDAEITVDAQPTEDTVAPAPTLTAPQSGTVTVAGDADGVAVIPCTIARRRICSRKRCCGL